MDFTGCLPKKLENLLEDVDEESEDFDNLYIRKKPGRLDDWSNLKIAIIGILEGGQLADNLLPPLHNIVSRLNRSKKGEFLIEWCEKKVLSLGINSLLDEVRLKEGKPLLEDLDVAWTYFFRNTLPTLEIIFYKSEKHEHIRKAALIVFRNYLVLEIDLLPSLKSVDFAVSSGIKHMFLILQNVHDGYPPSENRLKFEKLVARVIKPYLGFYGYYEGSANPVIESSEPAMVASRRASFEPTRRLDRPLSVQPTPLQLKELNEIYAKAVANRSSSFANDR